MTMTDIFVIIVLAFMALNGAMGGFIHALLGPISLIISALIGGLAYLLYRNFTAAIIVASIAPFFVGWGLKSAVRHFIHHDAPVHPSPLSRIGGLSVNLIVGGTMVTLLVGALSLIPLNQLGLGDISNDVMASKTAQLIEPIVLLRQSRDAGGKPCLSNLCSMTPEDAKTLNDDPVIQELTKDPRFQKILNSPELQSAIERSDFAAILNNPTMIELQQDPSFIIKAFRAYGTIRARERKSAAPPGP